MKMKYDFSFSVAKLRKLSSMVDDQRPAAQSVPDLLDLVGCDKGKYDPSELKKMLDKSRRNWR